MSRGDFTVSDLMKMRKPSWSVRPDYISKPSEKLYEWLESNTDSLKLLRAPQILQKVRAALGAQVNALNDADVDAVIRSWAEARKLPGVYPAGSPLSKAQELEIVTRLKKVINAIPTKIEVNGHQGSIVINASGVTGSIKTGKVQHSIGGSWGGELQFKTQAPGVQFAAAMSEQAWNLQLVLGKMAPLSDLDTVFRKGEAALRGALGDLNKVDWSNSTKTKQVFAPYLDPVKAAVDAASKSAGLKAGDISFGVWVGGDNSGGVTGGIKLTIVF